MKITKAALKRIIKEEIAVLEGSDAIRGSQRLGAAVDDLPSDIGSEESWDGPDELKPWSKTGASPEEKLINALLIRSHADKAGSAQEAAEMLGLGDDRGVINYLEANMKDMFLSSPGMHPNYNDHPSKY
tara:strand:- start:159 stop:545 length:387 start_codon:yes stop_codon:yes gene_type:complete